MKLSFKYSTKLNEKQIDIIEELSYHTTKLYNIVLTECKKYSVGNRFIINKNPETTEKDDIIGMINEVNSNLNNFIDNLTTEQLTK